MLVFTKVNNSAHDSIELMRLRQRTIPRSYSAFDHMQSTSYRLSESTGICVIRPAPPSRILSCGPFTGVTQSPATTCRLINSLGIPVTAVTNSCKYRTTELCTAYHMQYEEQATRMWPFKLDIGERAAERCAPAIGYVYLHVRSHCQHVRLMVGGVRMRCTWWSSTPTRLHNLP